MWHLLQKHSLRFAIFKRIAVCMQLISCSNGLGIRSNGSSYLLKKMVSHSNGSGCLCKKKLSSVWVARAICSKKIVRCLNGSSYLCKKNCFLLEQLRLSVWKNCQLFEQLGLSVRKKIVTSHAKTYTNGFPLNGWNARLPNGLQTAHSSVRTGSSNGWTGC